MFVWRVSPIPQTDISGRSYLKNEKNRKNRMVLPVHGANGGIRVDPKSLILKFRI